MYTIGEFSLITRLSVKTLRFYHEKQILIPDYIDEETGYRYYQESSVEQALTITILRNLEFSVSEIKEILDGKSEDADMVDYLKLQKKRIHELAQKYNKIGKELDSALHIIERNQMKEKMSLNIEEKNIEEITFAGIRFTGKYAQIGKAFAVVGRSCGRFIQGKSVGLYYDKEYKEDNADIEGGFPVADACLEKKLSNKNIRCRKLAGGKAVTLVHLGGYDTINLSYQKLFDYMSRKSYRPKSPSREIYHKGPGIFFKGNPAKCVTEIQFLVE